MNEPHVLGELAYALNELARHRLSSAPPRLRGMDANNQPASSRAAMILTAAANEPSCDSKARFPTGAAAELEEGVSEGCQYVISQPRRDPASVRFLLVDRPMLVVIVDAPPELVMVASGHEVVGRVIIRDPVFAGRL